MMTTHTTPASTRRFGAHLALSWWKPVIVLAVPPFGMIVLQIALFQAAGLIDSGSSQNEAVTPWQLLAVNASMSIAGVLTLPFVARLARVPWRTVLSYPRGFDRRRLGVYMAWALGFTVLSNTGMAIFAPAHTPWVGFSLTGTTMALIAIMALTTPLTAAAEELMFRGAALPAVASWVRPERLALELGAVVSSITFAATHLASDPWLFGYHVFLGLATAVMAIRSRGLEAPIAFHVANNTFTAILNALLAGGGDFAVERSAGAGGAHLFIPAIFVLATVVVVWIREGRVPRRDGKF